MRAATEHLERSVDALHARVQRSKDWRAAQQTVAACDADGLSISETARRLGSTRRWVYYLRDAARLSTSGEVVSVLLWRLSDVVRRNPEAVEALKRLRVLVRAMEVRDE